MLGTPAAVFSLLLVVTGLAKLRRPEETGRALAAFGLPSQRLTGSVVGFVETTLGTAALLIGGATLFMAQGLLYLGFVIWVMAALRHDVPLASCGCLGRPDTPPYWGHVVLDLLAMGVSIGAALQTAGPLPITTSLETLAHIVVVTVGALLAWAVIDHGARAHGASTRA